MPSSGEFLALNGHRPSTSPQNEIVRQRPLEKRSPLISTPGLIFAPHHGQFVNCAGKPLPRPSYLPPCSC